MDAAEALTRLQDVSSQVEAAVILDRKGDVVGSTLGDEHRTRRIARSALALLREGERRGQELAQLEVALQSGSVFVVRDAERLIAATTPPEPTVGLVFYDLKSCLRQLDEPRGDQGEREEAREAQAREHAATGEPVDSEAVAAEGEGGAA